MIRTSTMFLLAFLCASFAHAQSAAPVVREIHVRNLGSGQADEAFVLSRCRVAAGEKLDRGRVSRDVRALIDSGRFSRVEADLETLDDGVRLVYSVQHRPRLADDPEIVGADRLGRRKVRELLDLHRGDLVDEQLLRTRCTKIESEYLEKSYPDISVTARIVEVDAEARLVSVTVEVEEGTKSRIRGVRFTGHENLSRAELMVSLDPRPWWNPSRWFRRQGYEPDDLEAMRMAVLDAYLNRGYLDVQVAAPRIDRDEDGHRRAFIDVREGRAYRFGRVELDGVTAFPEVELAGRIAALTGNAASASAVRRSAESLEEFYGRRGYVDAMVGAGLDADAESGEVNLQFTVAEGEPAFIRNIVIRGNTRTRDKVVRRELLVYPGDLFDKSRVQTSERRVSNLGFFSQVRSHPVPTADPAQKDLVIDVEEKRTGQFMLGMGYSSVDQVIGFAELSQGNFDLFGYPYFTGGGQKLKLRAQFGKVRQSYDLSFVEPWFLDRRVALGLDAYLSEVEYTDYVLKRSGGAISLGTSLPLSSRVDLRYRLEQVQLKDFADTNRYIYLDSPHALYSFADEEDDRTESSATLTLSHDTRDNPFIPTRGTRVVAFGSISGGPLGFDTDIYGVGARVSQYIPLLFGHVLSLRARAEVVEAYADTDLVPLADRLFLGGGQTLRGFGWRDVGPKVLPLDASDVRYRPVGGQTMAMASVEYTVPLVDGIRLAGFYDIGNVWREPFAFDLGNLASSVGVGVRIDMPGFPMRIDYAWVIEKDNPITDEDPWVVWIGYDY
ncbi:MAG: outer membrane protein assembly factor BamA [Lentisphaerae bacterium]|nr:outer membrane protein assembly factor BamA [Lentisphaerota bacterium]